MVESDKCSKKLRQESISDKVHEARVRQESISDEVHEARVNQGSSEFRDERTRRPPRPPRATLPYILRAEAVGKGSEQDRVQSSSKLRGRKDCNLERWRMTATCTTLLAYATCNVARCNGGGTVEVEILPVT